MRQTPGALTCGVETKGRVPDASLCAVIPRESPLPPEYILAIMWGQEDRAEPSDIDLVGLRSITIPVPKPSEVDAIVNRVISLEDAYRKGAGTTIKWACDDLRRRVEHVMR